MLFRRHAKKSNIFSACSHYNFVFFLLYYRKSSNRMHNNSVHILSIVIYTLPLLQIFNNYSVHCSEFKVITYLSFTSNNWHV